MKDIFKTILRYLSMPILIPFIWILKLIHTIKLSLIKDNETEKTASLLKLTFLIESLHNYIKGIDPDTLDVIFRKRYKDGKMYTYDWEYWGGRQPTDEEIDKYIEEELIAKGVEGEEDEYTHWTEEDWAIYNEGSDLIYAIYKARENRKIANNEANIYAYDEDIKEVMSMQSSDPRGALKRVKQMIEEDENPKEIMVIYNFTK